MIAVVPWAREFARGDAEGAETMRGASAADRGARSARAQGTTRPLPGPAPVAEPGAASGPRSTVFSAPSASPREITVLTVRRELAATLWDAAGPPPAEDARPVRARGRRA